MLRLIATSLLAASVTSAVAAADLSTWEGLVRQSCPSRHLEWTCDDCWDDFLNDFESTLPASTQHEIAVLADYSRRCRREVAGFSCEMSVNVDAIKHLHLLKRFVAWGCANYRCEYAAMCTRTKPLPSSP